MEWLAKAWEWFMAGGGLVIVAALLAVSEALALIPAVKSNSVFQWIKNAIAWVYGKLAKK